MPSRKTFSLALLLTVAACAHQLPDEVDTESDDGAGGLASGGAANSAGRSGLPTSGSSSAATSGTTTGGSSSLPPVGSSGGRGGSTSGGKGGKGGGGAGGDGTGGGGGSGTVNMPIVGLSVDFKPADSAEMSAWLGGELSVINDTAQPLTVADLKIRYYFTDDAAGAPNPVTVAMNWAQCGPMNNLGGATCTGQIVKLTPSKPTADSYVELTCQSSSTPELTAGTLLKASWKAGANGNSALQYQKDDHSFSDPTHIVVLNGNTVVWGIEP